MAKPAMKFIATTKDKVDDIVISAGQLIFVQDDRSIYLDVSDSKRTTYQNIITVVDEETRQGIVSPIDGFYYVRQDNTLWNYSNFTWIQITGQGSEVVKFEDEGLPERGIRNALYVKDISIYRWSDTINDYETVTSKVEWENM